MVTKACVHGSRFPKCKKGPSVRAKVVSLMFSNLTSVHSGFFLIAWPAIHPISVGPFFFRGRTALSPCSMMMDVRLQLPRSITDCVAPRRMFAALAVICMLANRPGI
ncbi:hypothetical protein VNO77_02436 [Canavalia gladiata]|uniref:Uncharacterized protein n=1 Tax=Canavalia gladiata TaxID=3824 RepID=A0AAN9MZH7_CANGL